MAYTTRYMEIALRSSVRQSLWVLAGLDLLLVMSLSALLWWLILRPLREIRNLAGLVSSGADVAVLPTGAAFYGEFQYVRQSLLRTFDLLQKDIKERKQAEVTLHRLNRELRAISLCNQTLMRAEDEQTLVSDICRIVCDQAGYRMAWVGYAVHDEAKTLRPVTWAGAEEGYLSQVQFTWAETGRGRGPAGQAIRLGESSFQDFLTDPQSAPWRESALQRGYRIGIALPLKDENANTFGVLCIYSSEPIDYALEEQRLLEELAGDLAFGICVLRARNVQKQAEEALRASEAQNRALLNAIPDFIFTNARNGEFLAVRASDPSLLYLPPEAFLHRRARDVLPEPLAHLFESAFSRALEEGRLQQFEYGMTLGGEEKQFEARVVPCAADKVISIVRNTTEQKRAEAQQRHLQAQLLQSQKMESLGILAGGVAHDMNNVLGAIQGIAESNLETQAEGSREFHAFETIIRAAERGGGMVKSLLRFARQTPAEERELNLNTILREEVSLLERTTLAKVSLQMDLDPDLHVIVGDASALTHALMNLCVNAVDAMPGNGTLTLRTRNLDRDWVEVQVEDTGTGMPKEILEKALDPFFTTKGPGKGTGLGLSMVYSTMQAHHGQMEIQSQPGKGTRVILRFPARGKPPRTVERGSDPKANPTITALNVLVVDDDDLVQNSTQALLGCLGHKVTIASSGEEALAKVEGGFNPDVVILDLNMPGLGGAATLPRLRALLPSVPVLLATGRVDQDALNLLKANQHVSLLPKPYSKELLHQHLEGLGR